MGKNKYPIFLFLISLLFSFSPSSLSAQPRIQVREGTSLELGEIEEGTVIKKNLTLINAGTGTLRIDSVRATCGCTTAKLKTKQLNPGDSTRVAITIKTDNFRGLLKKNVYLYSNDPDQEELDIIMNLTVRNPLECDPVFVNFHSLRLGSRKEATIKVFNRTSSPITLSSLASPDSQITLESSGKIIKPKGYIELKAVLLPKREGKVLGQFEIITNYRNKPIIKLSYIGQIVR